MTDFETKRFPITFIDEDDDCGHGAGLRIKATVTADCHDDSQIDFHEIAYTVIADASGQPIYSQAVGNSEVFSVEQWRRIDNFVRDTIEDQRVFLEAIAASASPIEIHYPVETEE